MSLTGRSKPLNNYTGNGVSEEWEWKRNEDKA